MTWSTRANNGDAMPAVRFLYDQDAGNGKWDNIETLSASNHGDGLHWPLWPAKRRRKAPRSRYLDRAAQVLPPIIRPFQDVCRRLADHVYAEEWAASEERERTSSSSSTGLFQAGSCTGQDCLAESYQHARIAKSKPKCTTRNYACIGLHDGQLGRRAHDRAVWQSLRDMYIAIGRHTRRLVLQQAPARRELPP